MRYTKLKYWKIAHARGELSKMVFPTRDNALAIAKRIGRKSVEPVFIKSKY